MLVEDEVRGDGGRQLREGRDFRDAAELAARLPRRAGKWIAETPADKLAAGVLREMYWLEQGGGLPSGLSWDQQPAWRVELWEHYLKERERAAAAASVSDW